jgi:hypothetical protein
MEKRQRPLITLRASMIMPFRVGTEVSAFSKYLGKKNQLLHLSTGGPGTTSFVLVGQLQRIENSEQCATKSESHL